MKSIDPRLSKSTITPSRKNASRSRRQSKLKNINKSQEINSAVAFLEPSGPASLTPFKAPSIMPSKEPQFSDATVTAVPEVDLRTIVENREPASSSAVGAFQILDDLGDNPSSSMKKRRRASSSTQSSMQSKLTKTKEPIACRCCGSTGVPLLLGGRKLFRQFLRGELIIYSTRRLL
jgi:hypothetical protein